MTSIKTIKVNTNIKWSTGHPTYQLDDTHTHSVREMYNACFLLSKYHWDVTESASIHPFSKPLSPFKVTGHWNPSQHASVASLSQELAHTDRHIHAYIHTLRQFRAANSLKLRLWTVGEQGKHASCTQEGLCRSLLWKGDSESSHWTKLWCLREANTPHCHCTGQLPVSKWNWVFDDKRSTD